MEKEVIDVNKVIQMQQAVAKKVKVEKNEYSPSQTDKIETISQIFVLSCLDDNEDGDARLLTRLFKNEFCFDHAENQWYWFNGNHWEKDLVKQVLKSIEKVVELYGEEVQRQAYNRSQAVINKDEAKQKKAEKLEEELLQRISRLQTLDRKLKILQLASAGKNSLGIAGEEWDSDPWLLGCANGVIDLKSGHFREGRQDDYIKSAATTEWLGIDAPADRWQQFLLEIFNNDKKLIDFIQRLLGSAVIGKVIEHIFPILWGDGRNGKGTLLETIKLVLGDLAGPLPSESLLEQKHTRSGSAPSPDILTLRGRRIVLGE